jgi:hypothetical protein
MSNIHANKEHPLSVMLDTCNSKEVYALQKLNWENQAICTACINAIDQARYMVTDCYGMSIGEEPQSPLPKKEITDLEVQEELLKARSNLVMVETCLHAMEVAADHIDNHCEQITGEIFKVNSEIENYTTIICTQRYSLAIGTDEGGDDAWLSNNGGEGVVMPLAELDKLLDQHFRSHF